MNSFFCPILVVSKFETRINKLSLIPAGEPPSGVIIIQMWILNTEIDLILPKKVNKNSQKNS